MRGSEYADSAMSCPASGYSLKDKAIRFFAASIDTIRHRTSWPIVKDVSGSAGLGIRDL